MRWRAALFLDAAWSGSQPGYARGGDGAFVLRVSGPFCALARLGYRHRASVVRGRIVTSRRTGRTASPARTLVPAAQELVVFDESYAVDATLAVDASLAELRGRFEAGLQGAPASVWARESAVSVNTTEGVGDE